MSLVSQLFLLTAIRHLATDGLEEVPLTVANLNSEKKSTSNLDHQVFFFPSPVFSRIYRWSSARHFSLASAQKKLVVFSCWHRIKSFGLMLRFYCMTWFLVVFFILEKRQQRHRLSLCFFLFISLLLCREQMKPDAFWFWSCLFIQLPFLLSPVSYEHIEWLLCGQIFLWCSCSLGPKVKLIWFCWSEAQAAPTSYWSVNTTSDVVGICTNIDSY